MENTFPSKSRCIGEANPAIRPVVVEAPKLMIWRPWSQNRAITDLVAKLHSSLQVVFLKMLGAPIQDASTVSPDSSAMGPIGIFVRIALISSPNARLPRVLMLLGSFPSGDIVECPSCRGAND